MTNFLLISIGAILGANARYLIGQWASTAIGTGFPYGTAIVNISGSFVMGLLLAWGSDRGGLSPELRLLLTVGFLGAYTTFSSFSADTLHQASTVGLASAFLNIAVNNGLGIAAAWVGMTLAKMTT